MLGALKQVVWEGGCCSDTGEERCARRGLAILLIGLLVTTYFTLPFLENVFISPLMLKYSLTGAQFLYFVSYRIILVRNCRETNPPKISSVK